MNLVSYRFVYLEGAWVEIRWEPRIRLNPDSRMTILGGAPKLVTTPEAELQELDFAKEWLFL